MSTTTIPYHIEARNLGANIEIIRPSRLNRHSSAQDIRVIWPYHQHGLTVDQARTCIARWQRRSYHPDPYVPSPGRIVSMQRQAQQRREEYGQYRANLDATGDGLLTWDHPRMRWEIAGRAIITIRHESAEWDNDRSRYPSHTEVSYSSHLLRPDEPTTMALLSMAPMIDLASEASHLHNLRGNWRQHVLDALLPGTTYVEPPTICYKAVAVVDSNYYSIYDGSQYEIGVRRNGAAKPDHGGGYYCYATSTEAREADVPSESRYHDEPRAILECEVGGRCIGYANGKLAYSWIQPKAVVA